MKNVLFALLGFVLGIFVVSSINNGNIFSEASESTDGLIEQLDTILAGKKFQDRDYATSIMEKSDIMASLFPENSVPYLAMKYINANLVVMVSKMPVAAPVAAIKAAVDTEIHDSAAIVEETEVVEGEKTTTKVTNNAYKATTGLPMPPKEKVGTTTNTEDADLGSFAIGKKAAPTQVVTSSRKTVSDVTQYKYVIDGSTYDYDCIQLECMNTCVNLDAGYSEETCENQCKTKICQDIKKKGKLATREVFFAAPTTTK